MSEKDVWELYQNASPAAKGTLAHRLQNPKWPPGGPKMADAVGNVFTHRFLGILSNFR